MEIILFLIPISLVILILVITIFCWAIKDGQYDDIDKHAKAILLDDMNNDR